MAAYKVDSTLDAINDLLNAYYKGAFAATEEEKKTLLGAFYETTLPKWLSVIEKRLTSNSSQQYIVGDKMSIADFALTAVAYSQFYNDANPAKETILKPIIEKFPALDKYFKGHGESLKEYLASRPVSPW